MFAESTEVKTANSALLEQFERFFKIYQEVLPYINLNSEVQDYYNQRKKWIERLQQAEFPIAFFGAFNSGKSTVINAILNKDILPVANKETTALPIIVRKGNVDEAIVHYLDQIGKFELRKLLVEEIAKQLHVQPHDIPVVEDRDQYIQSIKEKIRLFEIDTKQNFNSEVFDKLSYLLRHEGDFSHQEEIVSHDDLYKYTEDFEGSLFIDRIEVFIKDVNLPDDIILVDLPGLGVPNKRHVRITKDYIQNHAKAFVVCLHPDKLFGNEEISFLQTINSENPSILQRSFWLLNKWDKEVGQQAEEAELNFRKKLNNYHFKVENNRIFKVSALNYLLFIKGRDKTLEVTKRLKDYKESLRNCDIERLGVDQAYAQSFFTSNAAVKNFSSFVEELFNYLNNTAKEEFLNGARNELLSIVFDLIKILGPLDRQYPADTDQQEKILFAGAVDQELIPFLDKLESTIDKAVTKLRLSQSIAFLRDAEQQEIINSIEIATKENVDELRNQVREGLDVRESLSRLPMLIEKRLTKDDQFRKVIVDSISPIFIENFLKQLFLSLVNVNKNYLPDEVVDSLDDILSRRDVAMRLHGLADSILYKYLEQIDTIGLNIKERIKPDDENNIVNILNYYNDELKKYILKIGERLNQVLNLSLKNHAEYIKRQLSEVLKQNRGLIHDQVARKLKVSDAIAAEIHKRRLIADSLDSLIELRKEI